MGRPQGARNVDYEATREKLAGKLLEAVIRDGAQVSLHELARAAEVSIPTLKHYFGDRSGVVAEALRAARKLGAQHLAEMADPKGMGLEESVTKVANDIAGAWVPFIGRMFTQGLSAGLFDETAGPGYLDGILEPTVLAMEARLRGHAARGEVRLDAGDELAVRTAALGFLSPLLVAMIHQHGLAGTKCRPLDVGRFVELHVERFVAAYGVPAAARKRR